MRSRTVAGHRRHRRDQRRSRSPRAAGAAAARSPAARASSPTTRSSSACSTTSPASTRTCPAPTARSPSRWRSTTTRPSTATRPSPRPSRSSRPTTRTRPTSPTPRRRRCTTGRRPTSSSTCPNSAAALAVATQAKAKKKLYINIGAGTTALTGASCNKYTFHWAYNTAVLAQGTAGTIIEGRRQDLEHRLPRLRLRPGHEQVVQRRGHRRPAARVGQSIASPVPQRQLRHVHHQGRRRQPAGRRHRCTPVATSSTSSSSSTRARSRARSQLAVGLMFITDIHSLGVDQFAGTQFTDAWYWNFDEQNKKWADRFKEKTEHPSVVRPRRQLLGRDELPRGRPGGRHRRRRHHRRQARGQEDQRRLPAQRRGPQGRPRRHPRRLPRQGQELGPVEEWDYEEIVKTIPAAEAYGEANAACSMS